LLGSSRAIAKANRRNKLVIRVSSSAKMVSKIHHEDYGEVLDTFYILPLSAGSLYVKLRQMRVMTKDRVFSFGSFADVINRAFRLGREVIVKPRNRVPGRRLIRANFSRRKPRVSLSMGTTHQQYLYVDQQSQYYEPGTKPTSITVKKGPPPDDVSTLEMQGASAEEFVDTVEELVALHDFSEIDKVDNKGKPPSKAKQKKRARKIVDQLPPLSTLRGIARFQSKHVITNAQRLTTRVDRMPAPVLASMMRGIDQIYQNGSTENDHILLETSLIVATSLFTGLSPEEVVMLPKVNELSGLPKKYTICYSDKYRVWIRPYDEPSRKALTEDQEKIMLQTTPRVIIGDYMGIGRKLLKHNGCFWFHKKKLDRYKDCFKKVFVRWLSEKQNIPSKWLIFSKIGSFLPKFMQGLEEGDYIRNAVIFDQNDPLVSVQRFYTALERGELNRYFFAQVTRVRKLLEFEGYSTSQYGLFEWSDEQYKIPTGFSGDDWVPDTEAIRQVIQAHKTRIKEISKESNRFPRVEIHNVLTSYLAIGLSIATGLRSIRTPIPNLRLIDYRTGMMSLQEKDKRDGSHARQVYLPVRIREMIRLYLSHLRRLIQDMPMMQSPSQMVKVSKFRDKIRFNNSEFNIYLNETLFYLAIDENGVWHTDEWNGQTMMDQINLLFEEGWPISNAGRHLFRTWLTNGDVPGNMINSTMGQWSYGEEPHAPYSTYDPVLSREYISKDLDKMLDTLEYEVVDLDV
jgi:hypothetical protein